MNGLISGCGKDSRRARKALCAALFCAPALFGVTSSAHAQTATTGGSASSVIVTPLGLVKVKDLDFGRIAPRPTAGTVTLDPANQTCVTTGTLIHAGRCQAAQFAGMGARNQLIILRIQSVTSLTGPGTAMTLTNMRFAGNTDLPLVLTLGAASIHRINAATGIFDFKVGGRLNVNANQTPGTYQGTMVVRIDYF